jgi:hypothetical protein
MSASLESKIREGNQIDTLFKRLQHALRFLSAAAAAFAMQLQRCSFIFTNFSWTASW